MCLYGFNPETEMKHELTSFEKTALLMPLSRLWIKRSTVEHKYCVRRFQALFYLHFQLEIHLLMNLKMLFVIYFFNRNTFACVSHCHGNAVRRRALKTCLFGLISVTPLNKLFNLTCTAHLHHVSHHCIWKMITREDEIHAIGFFSNIKG